MKCELYSEVFTDVRTYTDLGDRSVLRPYQLALVFVDFHHHISKHSVSFTDDNDVHLISVQIKWSFLKIRRDSTQEHR